MHFSCVELVLLLYTRACDFIMRLHPDLFILMCLFVLKKIKKEEGTKKNKRVWNVAETVEY